MNDICIIDGNSLGNASHYVGKNRKQERLSVGDMETQATFYTLKFAERIVDEYPNFGKLWLWDGRAQWRFDLYPEYKQNRKPKNEEERLLKEQYQNQLVYIQRAIDYLGMSQFKCSNLESDDLAGYFSNVYNKQGMSTILITADKDWVQLVNDKVHWYDPVHDKAKEKIINKDNFLDMTGYSSPQGFLDGKALNGDRSDNISGVGGIGEKTAMFIVAEYGSVDNFLSLVDSGKIKPKNKREERLASEEGREIFYRNRKLMNLIDGKAPEKTKIVLMSKGNFDADKFLDLCVDLNFGSIIRDFKNFIAPFEREFNNKEKRNGQ